VAALSKTKNQADQALFRFRCKPVVCLIDTVEKNRNLDSKPLWDACSWVGPRIGWQHGNTGARCMFSI